MRVEARALCSADWLRRFVQPARKRQRHFSGSCERARGRVPGMIMRGDIYAACAVAFIASQTHEYVYSGDYLADSGRTKTQVSCTFLKGNFEAFKRSIERYNATTTPHQILSRQ
jgi:hypothetical protein